MIIDLPNNVHNAKIRNSSNSHKWEEDIHTGTLTGCKEATVKMTHGPCNSRQKCYVGNKKQAMTNPQNMAQTMIPKTVH